MKKPSAPFRPRMRPSAGPWHWPDRPRLFPQRHPQFRSVSAVEALAGAALAVNVATAVPGDVTAASARRHHILGRPSGKDRQIAADRGIMRFPTLHPTQWGGASPRAR